MSSLKLFSPLAQDARCSVALFDPEEYSDAAATAATPVLLPFARRDARFSDECATAVLSRSRLVFQNRCCPECRRAAVEPLDDDRPLASRRLTAHVARADLVGFRCLACHHEWSV